MPAEKFKSNKMAEKFELFDTEEDLINHVIGRGATKKDLDSLYEELIHEREHAKRARGLGYSNIKWGYRVVRDDQTNKVLDFRYLIQVEGVTCEDAIKISKSPEDPSDLDKKVSEIARITKALDDIGYPRGYIEEDYKE